MTDTATDDSITCTSANEFIEILRLNNERWWQHDAQLCPWVFRGQRDASWALQPSAWRTEPVPAMRNAIDLVDTRGVNVGPKEQPGRFFWLQAVAERWLVASFLHELQTSGIRAPSRDPLSSDPLAHYFVPASSPKDADNEFFRGTLNIERSHEALVALAQHHGIPTRLLDWTSDPMTAALFASDGKSGPEGLCVWALNTRAMGHKSGINYKPRFESLVIPSGENDFLVAQCGLFTVLKNPFDDVTKYRRRRTVDEIIVDMPGVQLIKVVLPAKHVEELRTLLRRGGYTMNRLQPSAESAATSVIDRYGSLSEEID